MKKFIFVVLFLSATSLFAQPGFDPIDPDPVPDPPAIPIDGGLTAFLAAALGFGVKKIYDLRKNK